MIITLEQFIDWVERNGSTHGSKKSLYDHIARLTGVPYHTVKGWHHKQIKPHHAALTLINQAIDTGELPE